MWAAPQTSQHRHVAKSRPHATPCALPALVAAQQLLLRHPWLGQPLRPSPTQFFPACSSAAAGRPCPPVAAVMRPSAHSSPTNAGGPPPIEDESRRLLQRLQELRVPTRPVIRPQPQPARPPAGDASAADAPAGGLARLRWRRLRGAMGAQQQPAAEGQQLQRHQQQQQQQQQQQIQQQQQQQQTAPASVAHDGGHAVDAAAQKQDAQPQPQLEAPQFLHSPVLMVSPHAETRPLAGSIAQSFHMHNHLLLFAEGQDGCYAAVKALATARKMLRSSNPRAVLLVQPTRRGMRPGPSGRSYALDVVSLPGLPDYAPAAAAGPAGGGVGQGRQGGGLPGQQWQGGWRTGQQQQQSQPQPQQQQSEEGEEDEEAARMLGGDRYLRVSASVDELRLAERIVAGMPRRAGAHTVLKVIGPFAVVGALGAVAAARRLMRMTHGEELALMPVWERGAAQRHMLRLVVVRCTQHSGADLQPSRAPRLPRAEAAEAAAARRRSGDGSMALDSSMAARGTGGIRMPNYT